MPLADIDRRTIATRLAEIEIGSGAVTRNRVRSCLSAFFAWAIREGCLKSIPLAELAKLLRVDQGKEVSNRKRTLDLPRFRGGLRAWDQGIWFDGILLSCLVAFFLFGPWRSHSSRPGPHNGAAVARSGGQGRPHLRAARRACP